MPNVRVVRHYIESSVDLALSRRSFSDGSGTPRNEVLLEDALVHLMKKVGSERHPNVAMREGRPSMALARDAGLGSSNSLGFNPLPVVVKDPRKIFSILRVPRQWVSAFLWMDVASRAEVLLTASDQALLRMIADVADQKEIAVTDVLVSADHLRSLATSFVQRTQENAHASME